MPQEALYTNDAFVEPFFDIAETFLIALDETAEIWTFQTFSDQKRGDQSLVRIFHGAFEHHRHDLARLNNRGAGIFVTVNETDGKGRKASNIIRVRALFVDLDGSPLQPVLSGPLSPHIVVKSSPGRFHAYWRVADCPPDRFEGIQRQLVARFQGDPKCVDLPRVMRLPGFVHRKEEPFRSEILENDPGEYTLDEIVQAFDIKETVSTPPPPPHTPPPGNLPPDWKAQAATVAAKAASRTHRDPQSSRHGQCLWLGGELARLGIPATPEVVEFALIRFAEICRTTDTGGKSVPVDFANERKAIFHGYSKANQSHTTDREHREHREQPSCTRAEAVPGGDFSTGTPGTDLPIVNIDPPCFAVHLAYCQYEGPNEEKRKLKPGVWWHGIKEIKEGREVTHTWICSPLTVEAITSGDTGAEFGRLLRFEDSHGHWREWAMPMRLLKGSGEELRGELLDQGVLIDPRSRSLLAQYLMSRHPKRKVLAATRIGWHGKAFVLPDQVIGTADVVFQSEVATLDDFTPGGTLDGWRQEIGCYAVGNIPLIISVATALTGPLLYRVNRQGGGIHWMGDSSCGKTTALEVAASCWGSPEFVRSWSATANGFEAVAAARNDTVLLLDEIGEASPHEVGRIAYMLANGQGKQRAGRTGTARSLQRWRLMTLSTGEKSLGAIMADIGRKPNTGQIVRLLAIPVDFTHGAFDALHGFPDGRALADHLKRARTQHYGHIGPAFVDRLLNDQRDHGVTLAKLTEAMAAEATTTLEGRAAGIFAMIGLAGELGIEYGLLPWPPASVIEAARLVFQRWRTAQIHPGSEDLQILHNVADFIGRHGDSRFSQIDDHSDRALVRDRAGWYRINEEGDRIYLFLTAALAEAGGSFEQKRIAQALDRAGWLNDKDPDRLTKKTRIPGGIRNLYHVIPRENLP